ncbi:hypothetical protein PF005_g13470 [Phytophthora fragariae]|uniref:Uncharacterized protein n=1 Tax=Phytophthora fragariae TaxID=53985 RepID=A0A6A3XX95_9STRA|nr:hypothetical protein PF005_g13470 [Phytophthora fragariae]
MNAILSRAGLSADQQRALGLDTIRDEVRHTRDKLEDALVSLRCLEEVIRLARGVHKSRMPLSVLVPDVQAPLVLVATTTGKLDEAGLRDLHSLIGTLLEKHPGSTGSFRWWHTKLHRFIQENYNVPSKSSLAVQAEVVSLLEEVQQWRSTQDFNVSMMDKTMSVVGRALRDPFDAWKPREDSRLAEVIGHLKMCINSYRDSLVQRRRRGDINAWLGQMSGCSFTPTLNMSSIPPARPREFFFSRSRNFKSLDEINEGFKLIAEAREENSFGLLTTALYSFLVKAPLTAHDLLPLHQLRVFNENVEELRRIVARVRGVLCRSR